VKRPAQWKSSAVRRPAQWKGAARQWRGSRGCQSPNRVPQGKAEGFGGDAIPPKGSGVSPAIVASTTKKLSSWIKPLRIFYSKPYIHVLHVLTTFYALALDVQTTLRVVGLCKHFKLRLGRHVFNLPGEYHESDGQWCAIFSTFDLHMVCYNCPLSETWCCTSHLEYWCKDIWLLPIHQPCPAGHWVLAVILIFSRKFLLFDSFAAVALWRHEIDVSKDSFLFKCCINLFLSGDYASHHMAHSCVQQAGSSSACYYWTSAIWQFSFLFSPVFTRFLVSGNLGNLEWEYILQIVKGQVRIDFTRLNPQWKPALHHSAQSCKYIRQKGKSEMTLYNPQCWLWHHPWCWDPLLKILSFTSTRIFLCPQFSKFSPLTHVILTLLSFHFANHFLLPIHHVPPMFIPSPPSMSSLLVPLSLYLKVTMASGQCKCSSISVCYSPDCHG